MKITKSTIDNLYNSILYLWGAIENPAEIKAKQTIKESPSKKIKKDLLKVNSNNCFYRKKS